MVGRWAEVALAVLAIVLLFACTRTGGSSAHSASPDETAPPAVSQSSRPPFGPSTSVPLGSSARPPDLTTSSSGGSLAPPGGPPGCSAAADLARSGDSAWGDSLSLLVQARALANDTSNPLASDAQLRALVPTARDIGRRLQADGQAYARLATGADVSQPALEVADAEQNLGGALAAVDRIDDLAVVAQGSAPTGAPSAELINRVEAARAAVARWAAGTCGVQLAAGH